MFKIRDSLKRLIGRVKKTMKLLRDWLLIIFGIVFTGLITGLSTFFSNYSRYDSKTLAWNTSLIVGGFLLACLLIFLVVRQISGIDNREKKETKEENDKRDNDLIEAFKQALKANNTDLAQEIKKALGRE